MRLSPIEIVLSADELLLLATVGTVKSNGIVVRRATAGAASAPAKKAPAPAKKKKANKVSPKVSSKTGKSPTQLTEQELAKLMELHKQGVGATEIERRIGLRPMKGKYAARIIAKLSKKQ
jgi:hypothetical protein